MTNFPRHPYRTRVNSKKMEDWREVEESMNNEFNPLKDQFGQIL